MKRVVLQRQKTIKENRPIAHRTPGQKRVILLGSSGSIGQSACQVARALPHHMKLVGFAVSKSTDELLKQIYEFRPEAVSVTDRDAAAAVRKDIPATCKLFEGEEGLVRLIEEVDADMVLVAIVGTAGLRPALKAIERRCDLAVASKEILVMAGEEVMERAFERGIKVLPIDSEHNAIFQCLQNAPNQEVRRLILTASGGPFRTGVQGVKQTVQFPAFATVPEKGNGSSKVFERKAQTEASEFVNVTVEMALKHPTWKMGKKITIDSATLFNKGLEMIEARWLFDIEMARIDVIIHPESIVHSMVEFVDHSVLAQLSHSDMCFPIQYAVTYPQRLSNPLRPLDFAKLSRLNFEAPNPKRFPALRLAREAGTIGGTMPAVMNAANEIAVDAFLNQRGTFPQIWEMVEAVMSVHNVIKKPSLEEILQADAWARRTASHFYKNGYFA